jgi:hypothetical protein
MRAAQLAMQVLAPGSPLACLDATGGENVEAACEKALFAAPASVAAASSYTAARLTLLSDVLAHIKAGGNLDSVLPALRRALEADRFGFVAHTLAMRDGCTSSHCGTLTLLREPERIRANLSAQTFDRYIDRYLPVWGQPSETPVADAAPASTATLAVSQPLAGQAQKKVVVDAEFPSVASIPAVSIMKPEPKAAPANVGGDGRGAASGRRSSRKAANTPPPVSTSSETLVPSVEPVWAPGTAAMPSSQALPPAPSPAQASAGQTPAAQ